MCVFKYYGNDRLNATAPFYLQHCSLSAVCSDQSHTYFYVLGSEGEPKREAKRAHRDPVSLHSVAWYGSTRVHPPRPYLHQPFVSGSHHRHGPCPGALQVQHFLHAVCWAVIVLPVHLCSYCVVIGSSVQGLVAQEHTLSLTACCNRSRTKAQSASWIFSNISAHNATTWFRPRWERWSQYFLSIKMSFRITLLRIKICFHQKCPHVFSFSLFFLLATSCLGFLSNILVLEINLECTMFKRDMKWSIIWKQTKCKNKQAH